MAQSDTRDATGQGGFATNTFHMKALPEQTRPVATRNRLTPTTTLRATCSHGAHVVAVVLKGLRLGCRQRRRVHGRLDNHLLLTVPAPSRQETAARPVWHTGNVTLSSQPSPAPALRNPCCVEEHVWA
eukprot:6685207-Prymnesium_polylepis.2